MAHEEDSEELTELADRITALEGQQASSMFNEIESRVSALEGQSASDKINILKSRVRELELKLKGEDDAPAPWYRTFKGYRDLLGIFTLCASIVYGVYNFIDQLKKSNQFQVTQEVVSLVKQLSEGGQGLGNEAILLSAYGEHALPILLNTLSVDPSPGLIQALDVISRKDPKAVIADLRERTEARLPDVIAGDSAAITAFRNYVRALGTVGHRAGIKQTVAVLNQFHSDLDCAHLQDQGTFVLDVVDRRAVCTDVKDACQNIEKDACQ